MSNHKFAVDPITGFLNRGGSLSLARRVSCAVNAKCQPLAVLWLYLDRSHKVNPSFGQRGGDRIIAQFATRIRVLVPQTSHGMRRGSDSPGSALSRRLAAVHSSS